MFLVISGLVLETGGLLSHGACLSREYGLPAVAVPQAISRMPDGATITVNGTLGGMRIGEDGSTGNGAVSEAVGTEVGA